MRRHLALSLCLLVVLGCTQGSPGDETALSAKERALWVKYRQKATTRPDYRIAVYRVKEKDWDLYSAEGEWKSDLTGGVVSDQEEAETRAKRVANRPNIKAVAILEMLQDDDPDVVEWAVDDGRGAQLLETRTHRGIGGAP